MPTTHTERANSPSIPVGGRTSVNTSAGAKTIDLIALVLMIVGGLNWGLVGLFNYDLVAAIFGPMSLAARAVYVLVGVAAVYGIVTAIRLAQRHV
jgi:uncharacterized membrane protein YuzA (DUF378 family)